MVSPARQALAVFCHLMDPAAGGGQGEGLSRRRRALANWRTGCLPS
jgi:hypothetical protein